MRGCDGWGAISQNGTAAPEDGFEGSLALLRPDAKGTKVVIISSVTKISLKLRAKEITYSF